VEKREDRPRSVERIIQVRKLREGEIEREVKKAGKRGGGRESVERRIQVWKLRERERGKEGEVWRDKERRLDR